MTDRQATRTAMFMRIWTACVQQAWRHAWATGGQLAQYCNRAGDRCPIGHLLTTDELQFLTDTGRQHHAIDTLPRIERLWDDLDFYIAVQRAHDTCTTPEAYQANMRAIAARFELPIPRC